MAVAEKQQTVIGASVPRLDVREKVTGAAVYADDIQFGPGLLHCRVKRSPIPHGIIKRIDTSKAEKLPGVKVVVTGADFPDRIGLYLKDRHIFARDRVRFIGEPVAAVAAVTEEIAEKALELIDVEYEELPGVFDPVYGASPEAPLLHPELGTYEYPNFIFPKPGTNIANHFKIRKGDTEAAWPQCAAIVEHTFRIPHVQHVPIEPHVAVAKAEENGQVTLWASTQSPFAQRALIAKALHIPESKLRVIAPFVGGGFGCKAGVTMEAIPVAVALKLPGYPIKLRLTREEEFYTNFVRQGLVIKIKVGCDKDGNLLALENTMYWDGGAYTEYGVNVTRAGGYSSTGPYDIPNVKTDSMCVYTNHPVGGAYRGFGMAELHTGIDQAMDMLAEKIGMDRVEFFKKNCIRGGDVLATGMVIHDVGIEDCIDAVAKDLNWGVKEKPSGPNKVRGKGIALAWKAPAMPPNAGSSAIVKLNADGTVDVSVGGQEIGQGTFTVMAQIAAETLGVPYENVRVTGPIDTRYSPYEWQTVASRLTWSMGNAVRNAALDARQKVLNVVAEAWQQDPKELDIKNGYVISYRTEDTMPLKDVVVYGIPKPNDQGWIGGPIVGTGSFMPTYVTGLDPETGQGDRAVVHYTTGAQGVDLEVDLETGQITILKAVSAFDVGKAINPELVKQQMEGGMVQGLSSAIFEECKLEKGVMRNPSFVDYRIATAIDVPPIMDTFIIEHAQDDGPFGARGIGEHPLVPSIAAVASALRDALGIRITNPPFSAEKVYLALVEAGLAK
ncbi:xanthine dehydrogenase family protein molybdopterin-binding subunit [Anaerolinea thermophila]|uniref:Oxidoreductase molybdopterin binding subunit n=1 Tax=Anaerolinea thermophila (strain DSM 14523 / JCM 11388 / NBRC 100420 / UNI-1) TaxID=926569 RepID=E8N1K8_ANATU|nr:xanthine dehydrogenase family protein molybdopterin-binding subunit [Anaerolinea thermophila]BAJ62613.1 oxidoreductase molybdopterin binding subunit [Anaerolinea thermophila UNI-1]